MLAQPDRVDGDPVSSQTEIMPGDGLARIAVDVLIQAAEWNEAEGNDIAQNWEGMDTGSGLSERHFARASELRNLAGEVSRIVPPPPAPPAVTHTGA